MGFCYPGGERTGICRPARNARPCGRAAPVHLPERKLTLLVGGYAQGCYLKGRGKTTLTETVRDFRGHLPGIFPLPHPSWRSTIWMRRNPWFQTEALPALREALAKALR